MIDMLDHIRKTPATLSEQFDPLDIQIREIFSHREIFSIKEIILTGCGDSYFAGLAARYFFQKLCGIRTLAMPSMELSRHELPDYKSQFPANPFIVATSISGKVVRTVEALGIAKELNLLSLAITCNPDSALARNAQYVARLAMPPLPHIPGILSYRLSLISLFLLAVHIAEVKGNITLAEGDKYRDKLRASIERMNRTILKSEKAAKLLAAHYKKDNYFVFLGDGPNFASACFSAAKLVEASGRTAVPQNTEEWAHYQFFENTIPCTPTFLITSGHRGYSRLLELIEPLKRIGREIIAVAPERCTELIENAHSHLIVAGDIDKFFSPIELPTGCELFASFLAEYTHAQYFRDDSEVYKKGNTIYTNQSLSLNDIQKIKG